MGQAWGSDFPAVGRRFPKTSANIYPQQTPDTPASGSTAGGLRNSLRSDIFDRPV